MSACFRDGTIFAQKNHVDAGSRSLGIGKLSFASGQAEAARREFHVALLDCPRLARFRSTLIAATGISVDLLPLDATPVEIWRTLRKDAFVALAIESGDSALLQRTVRLCARIRETRIPAASPSVGGLVYIGLPFVVEPAAPALLLAGPIFTGSPMSASRTIAEQLNDCDAGSNPAKIRGAFARIPAVPPRKLGSILAFLALMAEELAETSHRWLLAERVDEPRCVTFAKKFVRENARNPLRQDEIARRAGVSPDHFARLFRRSMHMSCREYLARVRVELTKENLADSSCRVAEAAFSAGFQSIAQFNRVFSALVGLSPTAYRAQLARKH